ncbi:hypothetical protein [Streptomyces buecherae]|uniref:hypothetical protein n=2 Tax=Streptomyces buecherae TaxID=2763006 RepID=UPI001C2804DA|nr:hypothetical protein [Streptomyces buecherae]
MSDTPAPNPPDLKLAALIGKHDREAREDIAATGRESCAKCRALWIVAERAKALRDFAQARSAAEAWRAHEKRDHAAGGDSHGAE